jgi:LmbE family N-acetylglucosaminyl deacetylase
LILSFDRVLVLAPHTDDGELGCGGTLARLAEHKSAVHYVAFSICEASVPHGYPPDILAVEVEKASRILSISGERLTVHRYPVRKFPQHRQDILEELIRIRREVKPDLVFLPSTDDIHQDHQVIAQEGVRAFKHSTLLGYELPWNNLASNLSGFVVLERKHLEKKTEALRAYESQWHRSYWTEELITGLARTRGIQAGSGYAEAFQVLRWFAR